MDFWTDVSVWGRCGGHVAKVYQLCTTSEKPLSISQRPVLFPFYSRKEMARIQIDICLICQVSGVARGVGRQEARQVYKEYKVLAALHKGVGSRLVVLATLVRLLWWV